MDTACRVSCAVAAPTSCTATRLGLPLCVKVSHVTDRASTGALGAHVALAGIRQLASFSCVSSPASPTMNLHGCSLKEEAAQRAASNRLRIFSGSIFCGENARGLQRSLKRLRIG